VVVAPVSSEHTTASLTALAGHLPAMLQRDARDTLVDCGRFSASSSTRQIVEAADVVVVVTRPDAEGLASAHLACRWLDGVTSRVRVVVVGDRPYPQAEAEAVLQLPVVMIANDARAAAALAGRASGRSLTRSALIRSARAIVADLAAIDPRPHRDRMAAQHAGAGVDA
jgi:MinD-like ATPase involved in chromosome partitioning or flagellar assembly